MADSGLHSGTTQLVRVFIPDCKTQKCLVLNMAGTVWAAKQVILDKVYKELPRDALNYSLYLPPSGTGKCGKFMDDFLPISDYALQGNLPKVEMRYKSRDYTKQVTLTEKSIAKINSKTNQRKLVEYLMASSYKKIDKLLDSGLDPNFLTEDGNTPLGIACGRGRSVQCIQSLLSGGAHIDFRGKDGLTPMHRAAIGGNALAINSLLSYGASPNYKDLKGLTPVYHTAIMGDDMGSCITLLRNRAELGIKDQGGWSELHHTSKYGHVKHAELFIRYGADINDQNLVGNTPLHVAASHGQKECALTLLKRGANRTSTNFSGQTPSQVSILCGHHQLATEINEFPADQVEHITLQADYNENARTFATREFTTTTDTCLVSPPMETLANTLNKEWSTTWQPHDQRLMSLSAVNNSGRPGSGSSRASSQRFPDTESLNSVEMGSTHSDSTGGAPATPGPNTPINRKQSFGQQRERLYRAGPGEYVAVQEVEAQQPGDIPLKRGMPVEVTFIGKGGYWEGKAGGAEGWFPRLAIKEMDEDSFDFPTTDPPSTPTSVLSDNSASSLASNKTTNIRDVVVNRGNRGYGFAMRGVRATKAMQFQPSPEVPALQYVGSVEENGAAADAGLTPGDFLIEVNGYNVTHSTHDEVVVIVKGAGDSLRLKVITPIAKTKSISNHLMKQLTPVSTPESFRKDSILEESVVRKSSPLMTPKEPPRKHSPVNRHRDFIDKETIIGETVIGRTNSPYNMPTEWDSSQDDHEDMSTPTPGILNPSPNFKTPLSGVRSYSRDELLPPPNMGVHSHTLPAKDYPRLEDFSSQNSTDEYSDSDDDDSKLSAFQLELQKGKQKIDRRISSSLTPIDRGRANTLPVKGSAKNTTVDPSVAMTQQILNASKARKQRADSNQVRMSPHHSPKNSPKDPWVKALNLKAEALDYDETDSGSEVEPSSPFKAYLRPVKKPPPPVVKPKPKKELSTPSSLGGTTNWRPASPLLQKKQAPPIISEQNLLPNPLLSIDSLDFDLPPPISSDENRPNSFVAVAPPDGFSIPPIDDFIPPPLPQTSPPPTEVTSGESEVFIFPEYSPTPPSPIKMSSPLGIPTSKSIDNLPSPMPSPPSVGNSLLDVSSSVVPPPAFGEPSPWSPESDDTPPPLPLNEPPPLELDESCDTETTGSYSVNDVGSDTNIDMDTPPPRPPLPTSPTSSIAPEPTSQPPNGFADVPPPQPTQSNPLTVSDHASASAEEPGHKSTPLAEWGVEEVGKWLREIGLAEYSESFEENEIVGEHLLDLSKDELKELGIKKIGHQKKFQAKLSSLS